MSDGTTQVVQVGSKGPPKGRLGFRRRVLTQARAATIFRRVPREEA